MTDPNAVGSRVDRLQDRLAMSEIDTMDIITLAMCKLDLKPGENWVEQEGGLPRYIHEVACSIMEKRGKSVSNAIQIAIGVIKRWAKGVGNVNADTRAKAAAAVAEWEKMRASARGKPNK